MSTLFLFLLLNFYVCVLSLDANVTNCLGQTCGGGNMFCIIQEDNNGQLSGKCGDKHKCNQHSRHSCYYVTPAAHRHNYLDCCCSHQECVDNIQQATTTVHGVVQTTAPPMVSCLRKNCKSCMISVDNIGLFSWCVEPSACGTPKNPQCDSVHSLYENDRRGCCCKTSDCVSKLSAFYHEHLICSDCHDVTNQKSCLLNRVCIPGDVCKIRTEHGVTSSRCTPIRHCETQKIYDLHHPGHHDHRITICSTSNNETAIELNKIRSPTTTTAATKITTTQPTSPKTTALPSTSVATSTPGTASSTHLSTPSSASAVQTGLKCPFCVDGFQRHCSGDHVCLQGEECMINVLNGKLVSHCENPKVCETAKASSSGVYCCNDTVCIIDGFSNLHQVTTTPVPTQPSCVDHDPFHNCAALSTTLCTSTDPAVRNYVMSKCAKTCRFCQVVSG